MEGELEDMFGHMPYVAESLGESTEFIDTQAQLQELVDEGCRIQETLQKQIAASDACFSEAITSIKEYRQEITSVLQKHEEELEAEAKTIHSKNKKMLEATSVKLNETLVNIKGQLQTLSFQQKETKYFDFSVSVKHAKKFIPLVEREFDRTQQDSTVDAIKFEPNHLIFRDGRLGHITVSPIDAETRKTKAAALTGVSDPAERRSRSLSPKYVQRYTPSTESDPKQPSNVETAKGTPQSDSPDPTIIGHHITSSLLTDKEQDSAFTLTEGYLVAKSSVSPSRVGTSSKLRGRRIKSEILSQLASPTVSFEGTFMKGVKVGPMKVQIVVETIEEQEVDCVLVATNESLDLIRSGPFKALIQVGGATLQAECKSKYGRLEVGQVVMIDGGNLPCKAVCLTVLPPPGDHLEEELKNIVKHFLGLAQAKGYSSVALPALDTDCPQYPRDVVCRSMHEAVESWAKDYKTTSIEKVNFVMQNKDLDTIQVFQEYFDMLNEEERERESSCTPSYLMPTLDTNTQSFKCITVGPMNVKLVVETIEEQNVDCVLVTTNESLDLGKGGACNDLLQVGGTTLQDECKSEYGRLVVGQVVMIDGGELPCNSVCLTVLSPPGDYPEEELKRVVKTFLRLAQAKKYSSVAMTALGTGFLQFPRDVVCRAMHDALVGWAMENENTCIKNVRFVVHSKDRETIEVFQRLFDQLSGFDEKTRSCFTPFNAMPKQEPPYKTPVDFGKVGPMQIKLVVNSIEEQQVDCVLVTTNEDLDLGIGGACKDLFQVGGATLQEECKSKYGRLEVGQVVMIDGGNLPCKAVCLTVLPPPGDHLEQELKNVIKTFMKLAQDKKYASLAMPALGTGFMKYPRDIVCRGIHHALVNWSHENINTCIRNVRLVVHSTDRETIRVFKKYFDRLKKDE